MVLIKWERSFKHQ